MALLQSKMASKKISEPLLNFLEAEIFNFPSLRRLRTPLQGSEEMWAPDGVQALFVSNLLFGGLGYEDFGLYASLANDDRL